MLDKKFLFDAIFGQVVFGLMVIGKADFENSKFEGEQSAEDALLSFCCREWSRLSVWAASWQRVASKLDRSQLDECRKQRQLKVVHDTDF